MSSTITKDNLFRPLRSKAETKADITDSTARAIIDAEAESREAKTERLKKARLKMEAEQAESAEAQPEKKARTRAKPRAARKT